MDNKILTDKLKQSLTAIKTLKKELQELKEEQNPIAVIGMGCRFPGNVNNPEEFWQLLINKKDGIIDVPADRWDSNDILSKYKSIAGKISAQKGGFIDRIDQFDAFFFGISPLEAEALDPQQRILLQTTWQAIESAGIPMDDLKGSRTGVFIGISTSNYVHQRAASSNYESMDIYDVTGNTPSTAAGRISYAFDLIGPSMAIDTACSSSLVAVHLACNSLRNNESDLVIAGGVNVILRPNAHVIFSKMGALSLEGKCKTFDAGADGFVRSEGCGIVLLKRLNDAKRDGDNILGIIKGTAINQDGRSNGMIAPNGLAQQEVLKRALANAKVDSKDVSYIETHGTGTLLGDPIEIGAINHVYGINRTSDNPLYIGSVKTNLGHLESAAGIASFIKTILSLQYRCIPAHLNFKTPNSQIEWKDFLKVPVESKHFEQPTKKIVAGISAFGFSGTNVHVLVEEYNNELTNSFNPEEPSIVLLSAKSDEALKKMAEEYFVYLQKHPSLDLHEFAYSTAKGRSHFRKRLAILPASLNDCQIQLKDFLHNGITTFTPKKKQPENDSPTISFLFTGQGSQYPGMGRSLYKHQPVFKKAIDHCLSLLDEQNPIRAIFHDEDAAYDINQTQFAQPAIFIIEYALAKLWQSLGVKPAFLLGHSIGEVAAACYAQVFSLEDALKMIFARGKLMQALRTPGKMISISATKAQVEQVIAQFDGVSIAAINGEKSIVISGKADQVDLAMNIFISRSLQVNALKTSHAFHSDLMKPMLNEFKEICKAISFHLPTIRMVSTATGKNISTEIATAEYWVNHIIAPVLFYDGLKTLQKEGSNLFLEIGSNPVLSNLISLESGFKNTIVIGGLSRNHDDRISIARSVAHLYVNGVSISWNGFFKGCRLPRLPIPTYPFQERRYWIERMTEPETANQKGRHSFLGVKTKVAFEKNTYLWQTQFSLSTLPFLEDHQIEHAIVFPGACYTETAISAIIELTSSQQIELYDLKFEKIFILNKGEQYELQIRVKESENIYRFDIYTRIIDQSRDSDWVFRMSGNAIVKESAPEYMPDIDSIKANSQHISGEQFYEELFKAGNHWMNSFKGICDVWKSDSEILSLSKTPGVIKHQLDDFHSHPALMDICGQLLAAEAGQNHKGAFVGKGISKVVVFGRLEGNEFWSHAKIFKSTKNGTIEGDVKVYNAEGKLVAATTGIVFEFINAKTREVSTDQWVHSIQWETIGAIPENAINRELLVMDKRRTLTHAWTSLPGYVVQQVDDISELKSVLKSNQRIIYIPAEDNHFNSLVLAIRDIASILKCIAAHDGKDVRLWIITRQAFNNASKDKSLQSALWGLSKSIEIENEKSWGGIIDIANTQLTIQEYGRIAAWINSDSFENQVQFISNEVKAPRIVRSTLQPINAPELKNNVAYIITGGLGDLGLLTAQWMVHAGARRLILINRSGLPPRDQWKLPGHAEKTIKRIHKIKALENAGASIEIVQLDISDEPGFENWFNNYHARDLPEIKGVIHTAGNITPAVFGEETIELIEEQLAPKIKGAMTLHNVLGDELDFFILYSSASAILHSPRLAIYAAANSFMDALANSRRAEGLPALSINWGPWAEVGLAMKATGNGDTDHQIMDLISIEKGIQILERCWQAPEGQLAIFPIKWNRWKALFPGISATPYFQHVLFNKNESAGIGNDWSAIFKSNYEGIKIQLENYLVEKTIQLLRLKKNEIDINTSLAEYGLDSMVAIEFKNKIEEELKISLQIIDLINGPSISQLTDIISKYSNQELTEDPLKPEVQEISKNVPIELSLGQQSLWTLHQMDPMSAAYHIAFTTEIINGPDLDKLRKAFQFVFDRHAILRARFKETDGLIYQVIPPDEDTRQLNIEITDVAGLPDDQILKKIRTAYEKPFNLSEDTLVRCHLFDKGHGSYIMLLTLHHLVSDGWSLWILLDELKMAYSNLVDEIQVNLPITTFSYIDFISWQKKSLAGEQGQRMLDFWKAKLRGPLPVISLPTDHPRSEKNSGKTFRFEIDYTMTDKLRRFAQQESLTLYMATLGLFKILLFRYSGSEDIIVGSPVSGRSRTEFTEVVGDFINLVAIRTNPHRSLSIRKYLLEVKKAFLEALANQDLPFAYLIRELNPSREAGRTPVFQTLFSLQKPQKFQEIISLLEGNEVDWGKLRLRPFVMPQQEGQFDITLELIENSNGITGIFKYNDQLFEQRTIVRMQEHFINLVSVLIHDPDQLLSNVALSSKEVTGAILSRWHGPVLPLPVKCIHQIIDEQALRFPGEVALVYGEDKISYAELLQKVNGFASYLIESGIKQGDKAGLCLNRSIEMVIGILAVLKTGAAYVPLDPNFPQERLRFIADDSGISHLIANPVNISLFNTFKGKFINVDKEIPIAEHHRVLAFPAISSSDVAYIIYTSGSSGKPKGTIITHSNLSNFCLGMDKALGTSKGNLLAITTISFDIAVLELLWTLSNGFKVIIQSEGAGMLTTPSLIRETPARTMDFSLFYFSSADQEDSDKYKLLIDGAKYADEHGFKALWTPERHFHKFGGLFPNPSLTSAALATITSTIELRAGSVVAPLHNPLRIAEEWSVVDNLSHGRVGVSFASGWQANDFILSPGSFEERNELFKENIDIVKKLWAGDDVLVKNTSGDYVSCRLFPKPVQQTLPIWITTAGNINTFKNAGAKGANILTHLLTQSITELKDKIAAYKKARQENGFDPEDGKITIMLHAFIGSSMEEVKELVYTPFTNYLRNSFDLMKNMAGAFGINTDASEFATKGIDAILPRAFERYFNNASLMGTVSHCQKIVDQLYEIGINEIGCLIDFGVAYEHTMESLEKIKDLKNLYQGKKQKIYSVAENIRNHAVTHMQATPSLMRMLLSDQATRNELKTINKLFIGGERVSLSLVNEIREISDADIYNMYGPTENTVWSSVHNIKKDDEVISIGEPICNTQYYVLDQFLEPVQEGVIGELYISGLGVSAGYLNQPALTKEKFIKNPFSDNEPVLYKTGDLVRFNSAYEIEYIERADLQIKINGHRVEIGEIESVLGKIQSVNDCAVVHSDGTLIAYLVAKESKDIDVENIRSMLKATLPEYMIPKFFRIIDQMPLTPNAKINRKKLINLTGHKIEKRSDFVAPESDIEKNLAAIWQDLLGGKPVGAEDNFFELGGDSILSVQLVSRAKEYGLQFTVNQLFEHQTIRELAQVVKITKPLHHDQNEVVGSNRLIPIQHWFFELNLNNPNHYNQAFLLTLPENTNLTHLEQALRLIRKHHDVLRSSFRETDKVWQQVYDNDEISFFEPINLELTDKNKQDAFIREHAAKTQASLNISTGDLFKAVVYTTNEYSRPRLLIVAHHLVIDAYSWRIIFDDLNTLLLQQSQQMPAELLPKTTSYKAWSSKLNESVGSPFVDEQRSFWNRYNGNVAGTIAFDNHLPGMNTVDSTKNIVVSLSVSDSKDILEQLPKAYNIKINELLLAALYLTLAKWSATKEIFVDVEGHGREDLWMDMDVTRTVGWFTTMMPLRLYVEHSNNRADLLKTIKDLTRNAASKGIAYGILRYLSDLKEDIKSRRAGRSPVLFNYLGQFQMPLENWEYSHSDIGFLYDPSSQRSHLLEIIGMYAKGQFSFNWNYSHNLYTDSEIKRIADDFVMNLVKLKDYCLTTSQKGFTASDFPQARINDEDLEKLMLKLK